MLLSATTAGKHAQGALRLLPADGRRRRAHVRRGPDPGSFFRREGPPLDRGDPHLPPHRPPAAPLVRRRACATRSRSSSPCSSIEPDEYYDVLAINAASLSTQLSGLPFSGPIGGVRVALIDGQWVAFPKYSHARGGRLRHGRRRSRRHGGRRQRRRRDHDGRGRGHRQRVEPHQGRGAKPDREVVAEGLEASKPFIKAARRGAGRSPPRPPSRSRTSRSSSTTRTTYAAVEAAVPTSSRASHHRRQVGARQTLDDAQGRGSRRRSRRSSRPREGAVRRVPPPTSRSRSRSCASASSPTRSASTVAASPTSARSTPRWRSSRASTARRSSSAARPRSSASPR